MTIKAQTGRLWTASHAAAMVRTQVPSYVEVSARENVFVPSIVVTLAVSRLRWWLLRAQGRERVLVKACEVVSAAPAGLFVRIQWAR